MSTNLKKALNAVKNYKPESKWKPEHELHMSLLWANGKTCSEIAADLKKHGLKVSRNSVAAKKRRMEKSGIFFAPRPNPVPTKGKK